MVQPQVCHVVQPQVFQRMYELTVIHVIEIDDFYILFKKNKPQDMQNDIKIPACISNTLTQDIK